MTLPTIRPANASDAAAISLLLGRAFEEFKSLYTSEAFVATVQPESGVLNRLEEGPVWLAESEYGVVGTVSAACLVDSVIVRGMAVAPQARAQGLGKALLGLTEDFALNRGLGLLSLYTTPFLLGAIRLYQSFGFRFTGEKASPHGTELLRMVKSLSGEVKRL